MKSKIFSSFTMPFLHSQSRIAFVFGLMFLFMNVKPIRGFSRYECSIGGYVYFASTKDRVEPQTINGNKKYLLYGDNQDKKTLGIEHCLLLAFTKAYELGDRIIYRDRNQSNVSFQNLNFKKTPIDITLDSEADLKKIRIWHIHSKVRSANRRTSMGILTNDEVLRCLIVSNFKCYYCQEDLIPNRWHLDHYVPIIQGGKNQFSNIRPSCKNCNMMKGPMTLNQFRNRVNLLAVKLNEIDNNG